MIERFLTYVLIGLFVLQIESAAFDVHVIHEPTLAHFTEGLAHLDHFTDSANTVSKIAQSGHSKSIIQIDSQNDKNCDHCCLCHGHICPAVVISAPLHSLLKPTFSASSYNCTIAPKPIDSLLRPPIA